jgi:hypothetical protein
MQRMKRTEGVLLAAGILVLTALAIGCSGKTTTETVTVTGPTTTEPGETVTVTEPAKVERAEAAKIGPGAPTRRVEFGHVASLQRSGDGFVLRFDPAEMVTGVTASAAMEEDTGSSDVANDYYVVDEGERLFTYTVPADAHVTVLADGVDGTEITVAQLAKIVNGGQPLGHPLWEPLDTGVWILIDGDTVRSIDQQYVP